MSSPKTTKRGTPVSPRWDSDWSALVGHREDMLDRRICGAVAPNGFPCEFESVLANGRCPFHGGVPFIGGEQGNVNALKDGFHARRLRPCTNKCPHWKSCPMAGAEVETIPLHSRPACIYEQNEYEATVGTILGSMGIDAPEPDPEASLSLQFAQSMAMEAVAAYALTKVLAQRAAGALKSLPMSDTVEVSALDRSGQQTSVSGAAEACIKFQREQRYWHRRVMECGSMVIGIQEDAWAVEDAEKAVAEKVVEQPVEKATVAAKLDAKANEKADDREWIKPVSAPKVVVAPVKAVRPEPLTRKAFLQEPMELAMRKRPADTVENARPRTVLDGPLT
jgi:hypothetical protein